MGTLNHFAKDLSIPLDLESALHVIQQTHTALVDIGRMNDRTFINNSSIGVYPWIVERRDEEKSGSHIGKYVRMTVAFAACVKKFPLSRVRLILDDAREFEIKTPFIFVGRLPAMCMKVPSRI